jgi:hypothetical protein
VLQQSVCHCPNGGSSCGKQFVALAGLFKHLESEACGFMRFERVLGLQRELTEVMSGRRMIAGLF